MTFKEKLKKIIIDNIIVMIISFAAYAGSAYALSENFMPNLRGLWFILFFVGFIVFMYNVVVLMKVDNLGKRFHRDIKDLADGKIDDKHFGKPIE